MAEAVSRSATIRSNLPICAVRLVVKGVMLGFGDRRALEGQGPEEQQLVAHSRA